MARQKKPEEPGLSAPFYMGTYGDMVTLIVHAFIVISAAKKLAARSAYDVNAMEELKVYLPPAMREAFNQEEG